MSAIDNYQDVSLPYPSGVKLGVVITSPRAAGEIVSDWLGEIDAAIHQIDHLVAGDIVDPASRRGLTLMTKAGERALNLTTSIRRDLAIAIAAIDALGLYLPERCASSEPIVPPLRRAVAELRRQEAAWHAALAAYVATDETDTTGMSDEEISADGDAAAAALCELIATRAPHVEAVLSKMEILHTTDTVHNTGYFEQLLLDVKALASCGSPAHAPANTGA